MKAIEINKKIPVSATKDYVTFAHVKSLDTPGSHRLHLNNYVEVYIFVSGDANYIIGDECYELLPGDVLVITPHEVHVPNIKNECVYERYYLLFPLETFSEFSYDPLSPFIIGNEKKSPLFRPTGKVKEKISEILSELDSICSEELSDNSGLAAYSLALRLICLLNDGFATMESGYRSEHTASTPDIIRNVLLYINDEAGNISSVSDIAEKSHISLPYLSSTFKKYVGVTVGDYLRMKKIALAKKLLGAGSTVTHTCYECGFSDCSYFIKTFRRCVGITPNKYREKYLKIGK